MYTPVNLLTGYTGIYGGIFVTVRCWQYLVHAMELVPRSAG